MSGRPVHSGRLLDFREKATHSGQDDDRSHDASGGVEVQRGAGGEPQFGPIRGQINLGRFHLGQPLQGLLDALCSKTAEHAVDQEDRGFPLGSLCSPWTGREPGRGLGEKVSDLQSHTCIHVISCYNV